MKDRAYHRGLFIIITVLFLLTGIFSRPVQAQVNDEISLSFSSDNDTLTVGDVVTLTLSVTYPEGYQVVMPHIENQWGDFEVYSISSPETVSHDDHHQTSRVEYAVTLFSSGTFDTPPAAVTVKDAAGNTYEKQIPPITLTVMSVLTPEDTALRDIKPQADMPGPSPLLWILPGLAAAILLYWLVKRFIMPRFSREKEEAKTVFVDNRPAHQIAFEELNHIEERKLLQSGQVIEHYSQVGDCLRRYLEKLLSMRVLDRTTTELNQALKNTELPREQAGRFIDLFYENDLVKFARFQPDEERAAHLINHARQLIDQTKPVDAAALEENSHRRNHDGPL